MPKPQSNKNKTLNLTQCALRYFTKLPPKTDEKHKGKDIYACKKCKHELNGTKKSNLVTHLKTHDELFQNLCMDESIEQKRAKLLLDCVEFVAIDGNTFSKLSGTGFLSLIDKTLKELQDAAQSVNLTDSHYIEVKEMLKFTSQKVQQKIRDELKDRPFSLQVDITTKNRRSVLGVSAQYMLDGVHKIRSLGMLGLEKSHTGQYLAQVICELLTEYGFKSRQIIAIITDNGANVVKMVRDVSSRIVAVERTHQRPLLLDDDDENDNSSDTDIGAYLETVPDYTDDQVLDLLFDHADNEDDDITANLERHEILLNAMVSNLQNQNDMDTCEINGLRCAAHTLQLCIRDALGNMTNSIQDIITICRRIAKMMRLKTTAHELQITGMKYSLPKLDVETRWCSTYSMLMGVFNIKNIVEYFAAKNVQLFKIILQNWKTLNELVIVLEVPYNATIALQNPRITLSDVFGIWYAMEIHLKAFVGRKAYKTNLANTLLVALDSRRSAIFDNAEMDGCLFLDPRFRNAILSKPESTERAKAYLLKMQNRLSALKEATTPTNEVSNVSSELNFTFDAGAALNEQMLRSTADERAIFEVELDTFQPDHLPPEASVLKYWQTNRDSVLYDVAMAMFSIPPTQVKIEQDFSRVGYIFNERRYRLSQELLEAILRLHLNADLFQEVKKEKIDSFQHTSQ